MAKVHLVWTDRAPVTTDVGIAIAATTTFADYPEALDVLFVPGGLKGSVACMEDAEGLDFLAARGARARYVTSVCTGGLVLGAAGLLKGYRATAHWYVRDYLALMGATVDIRRQNPRESTLVMGGSAHEFGDFQARQGLTMMYRR